MNRSAAAPVVEPVTPLYKHFPSDKSEFGFSSEPTSPQHSKDLSSFVKKHKRHKSNTPTHKASRSLGLGRNTYPSAKYINNNSFFVDDVDSGGPRVNSSFVNGDSDVYFKPPQCDQEGRQIFLKVTSQSIASCITPLEISNPEITSQNKVVIPCPLSVAVSVGTLTTNSVSFENMPLNLLNERLTN